MGRMKRKALIIELFQLAQSSAFLFQRTKGSFSRETLPSTRPTAVNWYCQSLANVKQTGINCVKLKVTAKKRVETVDVPFECGAVWPGTTPQPFEFMFSRLNTAPHSLKKNCWL